METPLSLLLRIVDFSLNPLFTFDRHIHSAIMFIRLLSSFGVAAFPNQRRYQDLFPVRLLKAFPELAIG